MSELSEHADNIIKMNRALRAAADMCAPVDPEDTEVSYHGKIVAEYGQALKRPLAYIIRQQILFDANVLPYEKSIIKSALLECAKQRSADTNLLVSLGDLYFYLSYFIVGMEQRENDPGSDFFAEQESEGSALRAEWQNAVFSRKKSKFPQLLGSWFKPNA